MLFLQLLDVLLVEVWKIEDSLDQLQVATQNQLGVLNLGQLSTTAMLHLEGPHELTQRLRYANLLIPLQLFAQHIDEQTLHDGHSFFHLRLDRVEVFQQQTQHLLVGLHLSRSENGNVDLVEVISCVKLHVRSVANLVHSVLQFLVRLAPVGLFVFKYWLLHVENSVGVDGVSVVAFKNAKVF